MGVSVQVAQTRQSLREELRLLVRPNKSITIALDVDGTTAEVHEVMLKLYNAAKGTKFTIKDHTDWDFVAIGSNYEEMMKHYVDAWKNHHREIPLLADLKLIRKVGQLFVMDIASSRSGDGITDGTEAGYAKWVLMHRLDWMPHFSDSTKINKAEMLYDIYIDDSPRFAQKIAAGAKGFLLLIDRPYNRHIEDGNRVLRVANVNAAARELILASKDAGRAPWLYTADWGKRFIELGSELYFEELRAKKRPA